jgi:cytochrome c-type biogenesis protein CcmH
MMRGLAPLLVAIAALAAPPVYAVQPDEVLADPALEARAREISRELRCLVCRNESIDESHAPLARDLRIVVRERLAAGDTDAQVRDFVVARYGEFVLLRPDTTGANLVLWLAGPVMLGAGGLAAGLYLRRRAQAGGSPDLTEAEARRVRELMGE